MQTQSEIRTTITNRIIEALKGGIIPWRKPWSSVPDPVRLPTNFVTQRQYQGMNVILLRLTALEQAYPVSYWASFNQWKSVGAHVRKGEKGTPVIFWRPIEKRRIDDGGDEVRETFPILKTWTVFNVSQVEGEKVEQFHSTETSVPHFADIDRTEFDSAVASTQADIRYGLNQAAYHGPPSDFIVMPHEDHFHSFPAFAETLLHELAHWTEWRLGWKGNYAEGELRAEISACFLATALGVPNSEDLSNHVAYLQSWLQALENDPKFIFRAATAASKATDFILSLGKPHENIEEEAAVET